VPDKTEKQYVAWFRWRKTYVKLRKGRGVPSKKKWIENGDMVLPFNAKDDHEAQECVRSCIENFGGRDGCEYRVLEVWEVARKVPIDKSEKKVKS
jgi:hypothetical protein